MKLVDSLGIEILDFEGAGRESSNETKRESPADRFAEFKKDVLRILTSFEFNPK